jgi:hypothetical protein
MLGTSITITINGAAKVLKRVNDSEPYSATYFLADTSTKDYTLTIKHTIPSVRGASKESHLVRLDATDYDADGVVIRTQSSWTVNEVSVGRQDTTTLNYYAQGLMTYLSSANLALILDRDS